MIEALDRRTEWKSWSSYAENESFLKRYRLTHLHGRVIRWYLKIAAHGRTVSQFLWNVTGLYKKYYIKEFDSRRNLDADIAATNLIRSQTTIPIPLGLFQFRTVHHRYLLMERVSGISLHWVMWKLTAQDKERIIAQLRDYLGQLRSIKRPPETDPRIIASVTGGPIYCTRLHRDCELSGPFRNEEHMHLQIRFGRPVDDFPEPVPTVHRTSHPIVLTHNDFHARNIMVVETPNVGWQVSAIVDWECAGWLPDYWEYVKSLNLASRASLETKKTWNESWLPLILKPFEMEAEADMIFDHYPTLHVP